MDPTDIRPSVLHQKKCLVLEKFVGEFAIFKVASHKVRPLMDRIRQRFLIDQM